MGVELNHTIVRVRDKRESAQFLAEILGLDAPCRSARSGRADRQQRLPRTSPTTTDRSAAQHYAFLVSESDFDQIFARIRDRGLPYWADPGKRRPGEVNANDGGRGVYWEDPSGHFLEIITRPYGSGG